MSDLCQSLVNEHLIIKRVLDALDREAAKLEKGESVNTEFFEGAIAFVREFADGVHHQKEEVVLFPRMERAGVPRDGGPLGCMLAEHEEGRGCIRQMDSALAAAAEGDRAARTVLIEATQAYVGLLRAHIEKEDDILFHIADQVFDDAQKAEIGSEFIAAEEADAAVTAKRQAWAEAL